MSADNTQTTECNLEPIEDTQIGRSWGSTAGLRCLDCFLPFRFLRSRFSLVGVSKWPPWQAYAGVESNREAVLA